MSVNDQLAAFRPLDVLIACECSGVVRDEFIALGHNAISCDLLDTERPGPHHKGDVRPLLARRWDVLIAHPPCTFLSNSGAKHLYLPGGARNEARWAAMREAAEFFLLFLRAPVPLIAVENPIMVGHAKRIVGAEQTQTIQPWHFGHPEFKATCLWLKGLPRLQDTNRLVPPKSGTEEHRRWSRVHRMPPGADRQRERSRTFQGIARAMASQWGSDLT